MDIWTNSDFEDVGMSDICGPLALKNLDIIRNRRRSLRQISKSVQYKPGHGTMVKNIADYIGKVPLFEKSEMRYALTRELCIMAYSVTGPVRNGECESHVMLTIPLSGGETIAMINGYTEDYCDTEKFFEHIGLQGIDTNTKFVAGCCWPVSEYARI